MATRHTKFTVYVDKELMTKPDELVDAVYAHMIKKELDIRQRKRFLAGFMRAGEGAMQIKFIDTWVLVRDVASFPFRFNKKSAERNVELGDEDTITEDDVDLGEEGNDADTEVERGVSVDDGTNGEPESGVAPE